MAKQTGEKKGVVTQSGDEGLRESEFTVGGLSDITEGKRAEAALRESEERMQMVLQGADLGTWDWNVQTGAITYNERWAEMMGYTLDEIESQLSTWEKRVHPDDLPATKEVLNAHLEGKTDFYESEHRMMHKSGRWVWVSDRGKVIERNADGRPLRACGTYLDITKPKQIEKDLQESERRLSSHLQKTPIAAIEWNLDFEVVEWNAAAESIFGYTKDEALGKHAAGLLVPESAREQVNKVWNDLLENTGGIHSTNDNFTKDGRTIVCDWNNTSLVDEFGKVYGVASLVQDITERRKAEEALRKSEEKFRDLVETSQDLIWKCDAEGRFTYLNPAWEKTHGYKIVEMLGRPFMDFQTPEVAARDIKEFGRHLAGGSVTGYETSQISKSGETIHLVFNAIPLYDAKGIIIGTQGTAHDITERKLAEDSLRESEEKYRSFFRADASAVFLVDTDTLRLLDANPAAERIYGYTHEELLSMKATDLSAEPEKTGASIRVKADGVTRVPERRHRRKDGSILTVEIHAGYFNMQGRNVNVSTIQDITERKQTEDNLRHSEAELRAIYENAPLVMLLVDNQRRIVKLNAQAQFISGHSSEKTVGFRPGEALRCVHALDNPKGCGFSPACHDCGIRNAILRSLQTGEASHRLAATLRYDHTDGPVDMNVLVSTTPLNVSGEDLVLVCLEDITERKRVEEALRESEAKYKGIVESSHDAIMLTNPDGVILYVSPACKQVLGYDAEELVDKRPWIIHPDDIEKVKEFFYHALRGKSGSDIEYRINTKTNETKWVSHSWSPILDDGKLQLIVSAVRDITERKRAEEALRESEEKYRQLFMTESDAIIIFDAASRQIIDANNSALEMYGYSQEEFFKLTQTAITAELKASNVSIEKTLSGKPTRIPLRYHKKKDGTIFPVEISGRTFKLKEQQVVCGIIRDITERITDQRKLHEQRENLRRLSAEAALIEDRERRRLAVELHDEVGQPLAVAKMHLSRLRSREKVLPTEELDKIYQLLEESVAATRGLTFDLSPPVLHQLGLVPAIKSLAGQFSTQYNFAVAVEDDGHAKDLSEDLQFVLYRATRELLTNAFKHAGAWKAKVTIRKTATAIQLTVSDQGVGFSPNENPRYVPGEGFGLLSLGEQLIGFGGKLDIDSGPGQGSRIKISIPLKSGSDAKEN